MFTRSHAHTLARSHAHMLSRIIKGFGNQMKQAPEHFRKFKLLSDTASCFQLRDHHLAPISEKNPNVPTAGNQSRKSVNKEPVKYFGVLAGNESTHNLDVVTVAINADGVETIR